MARLLLGVTGGIAAYKAVEIVRLATAAGHSVRVIQTPASEQFVGRATFEGVTGAPVLVDEFEPDPARGAYPGDPVPDSDPISHLELVRRADAYAVAPASANTIAKLAGGHADNLLTSAALASVAPLVIAPAMNARMWEHPATAANVETLRLRGAVIVAPETGRLASRGEWGSGGWPSPRRCSRRSSAPWRTSPRARLRAALPRRAAGPRDGRRDPRADRLGPLRGQPLLGPDGAGPRSRGRPRAERRSPSWPPTSPSSTRPASTSSRSRRRASSKRPPGPSSRRPTCS